MLQRGFDDSGVTGVEDLDGFRKPALVGPPCANRIRRTDHDRNDETILREPGDGSVYAERKFAADAAAFVRAQTAEALAGGARALVDAAGFDADAEGTPCLALATDFISL